MPVPMPLTLEKIKNNIASWYTINIDHFRRQGYSNRYIADRVGETLFQEKKKGKINSYRILPQGNTLSYWMEKDGSRHYVELILYHKIDKQKNAIEAYDRAMKGI